MLGDAIANSGDLEDFQVPPVYQSVRLAGHNDGGTILHCDDHPPSPSVCGEEKCTAKSPLRCSVDLLGECMDQSTASYLQ